LAINAEDLQKALHPDPVDRMMLAAVKSIAAPHFANAKV